VYDGLGGKGWVPKAVHKNKSPHSYRRVKKLCIYYYILLRETVAEDYFSNIRERHIKKTVGRFEMNLTSSKYSVLIPVSCFMSFLCDLI
jgi:hypothetical protein